MTHVEHLNEEEAKNCRICSELLADVRAVASSKARVYYTYCEHDGEKYTVATSSRDVQLWLSQFLQEPRSILCHILREAIEDNNGDMIVFESPSLLGERSKSLMVTCSKPISGRKKHFLHLSPAY